MSRYSNREFFGGLAIAVGALVVAVWGAAQGWTYPTVFIPVMISWTGYLVAHHGETGQFVDEPRTGNAPSFPESRFPLVTAATLFVGGIRLGSSIADRIRCLVFTKSNHF
jgi:hypothetical protein